MAPRSRRCCTECRASFRPERSAAGHQRTCSETCRHARKQRLARRRRSKRVQDARVDERERQRASRARRATDGSGCHVQASEPKPVELVAKMLESFDSAIALSRAGLQRKLGVILRSSPRSVTADRDEAVVMSRAGLGA